MSDTARTPLVIGEAFRAAGDVLIQRGAVLWLLSALLVLPGGIAAAWLRRHSLLPVTDTSAGSVFFIGLANGSVNWLAQAAPYALFSATASWTIVETLEGRSPSVGETVDQGLRFFLPVLVAHALYTLGAMAGMVLLIVPGLIVALMWIFVTQAVVVERLGIIEAFKRSRTLTKGHRWALLGLGVASTLAVVAVEWIIFQVSTPTLAFVGATSAPINAYGVIPLFSCLTTPLSVAVMTTIYMQLRSDHRGSADLTAEVFA
jgi:hypothetical protein